MFKRVGPIMRQYAVVIIANLTIICFGMSVAWPSPVLVKLTSATHPVLSRPVTDEEGSWIVSTASLCNVFANFLAAFLIERIGRKYCIILTCVPKIVACFAYTFATEVWMLMLGRALDGVSESLAMTTVPTYAAEIASKEVRGALGTIFQICSSLGVVIMLSVGPFTSYVTMNVVFTCVAVVTTIPCLFVPETPFYLYSRGRKAESIKVLTFLRCSETTVNEELKQYSITNSDVKIDKRKLFKNKIFLKTLAIAMVIGFGQQAIGFNAVTFYLQTILESTHTSVKPEVASVVIGVIQLSASLCTSVVTDKFGRKPILATTLIGMALGMIGLGTFFEIRDAGNPIIGFMNYLPLISLILIIFCFSAGSGSVNFSLIAELFDGPARAIGVSMALSLTCLMVFLTTKYFIFFTTSLGPAVTYWAFGAICLLFCLFIVVFVPETKRKTFAEIQEALGYKY